MKSATVAQFTFPKLQGLKTAYDEEGYAIVRRVLDADLLSEANRHIDWLIEKHPDLETERLGHWLVADDPFWLRLISDDRLLDIAEQLIGPNIALFAADYIVKRPGTGGKFAWHQDGGYWPLEPMEVATLWIAYSASNRANGCLRIIPGTQHLPLQERAQVAEEPGELLPGMDQALADESNAVDIELDPGDVSLHHPHIIHGSKANTSDRWRRGGTFLYIPTTTHIRSEKFASFLLRGEAVAGINTYHEFPKYREGEHFRFRERDAWR